MAPQYKLYDYSGHVHSLTSTVPRTYKLYNFGFCFSHSDICVGCLLSNFYKPNLVTLLIGVTAYEQKPGYYEQILYDAVELYKQQGVEKALGRRT